ncbi:MAG: hypothetical protein HZB36_01420 [Candidatus Omnitrophica bacterium]|nr:hypothetical protein [Candidatus Omnitrophota bacterium]
MILRFNDHAVTLIELILAIVLVSAIIMTGLSMELGLRRIFSSTDFETQILDEAAPIMAMVTKDINRGVGAVATGQSPYNLAGGPGNMLYQIFYDSNNNGMRDGGDTAVEYRFQSALNALNYRRTLSASYQILSDKVIDFSIASPVNGASTFSIRLKRDPGSATSYTNPEIWINSSALYRGYSTN